MPRMPKISASPVSSDVPGLTPEQDKRLYKENYEFNKPTPVRSTVEPYAHERIANNDMYYTSKGEVNIVKGTPHKFKNIRTGSVYSNRRAIVRTRTK